MNILLNNSQKSIIGDRTFQLRCSQGFLISLDLVYSQIYDTAIYMGICCQASTCTMLVQVRSRGAFTNTNPSELPILQLSLCCKAPLKWNWRFACPSLFEEHYSQRNRSMGFDENNNYTNKSECMCAALFFSLNLITKIISPSLVFIFLILLIPPACTTERSTETY